MTQPDNASNIVPASSLARPPRRSSPLSRWLWIIGIVLYAVGGSLPIFFRTPHNPYALVLDTHGHVYLGNGGEKSYGLVKLGQFSGLPSFDWPFSITVDHARDIVLDAQGNLYVASTELDTIAKYDSQGNSLFQIHREFYSSQTKQVRGDFSKPRGVALDRQNNIYVADTGNQRIQKLDPNGHLVTKWGSEGRDNGQFEDPYALAVAKDGAVFVLDRGNGRIQKFDGDGKFLLAWNDADLSRAEGLTLDSQGNVYVSSSGKFLVSKFGPDGHLIHQWSKNNSKVEVGRIAVDTQDQVYVVDRASGTVLHFDSNGNELARVGWPQWFWDNFTFLWAVIILSLGLIFRFGLERSEAGQTFTFGLKNIKSLSLLFSWPFILLLGWGILHLLDSGIGNPKGIAVDPAGNVYVSNDYDDRAYIMQFNTLGFGKASWGASGIGVGELASPTILTTDLSGNLYVANTQTLRVNKFNRQGEFLGSLGHRDINDVKFLAIDGLTTDQAGNLYVTDSVRGIVQKFDPNGKPLTQWGNEGEGNAQLSIPTSIAVDKQGYVYVESAGKGIVQKFDSIGKFITDWHGVGSSLVVSSQGEIWLLNKYAGRLDKYDNQGRSLATLKLENLTYSSEQMAVDKDDNIYIASGESKVQKYNRDAQLQLFGVAGFSREFLGNIIWAGPALVFSAVVVIIILLQIFTHLRRKYFAKGSVKHLT